MEDIIYIHQDLDALANAVAKRWIELASQSIERSDAFHVALSGGSTPKSLYQTLAQPEYSRQIPWHKVCIYFGDERAVPPDHADSNYRLAKEELLDHVPIPESRIHPIYANPDNIRECADQYAQVLEQNLVSENGFPRFDLCLQGIGGDGHTASLFPDTDILNEQQRSVAEVYVEKLESWRISITFPVLENARTVLFLVSGEGKADIMQKVLQKALEQKALEGEGDIPFSVKRFPAQRLPVQRIRDRKEIEWFLDAAAASKLSKTEI